MTSYQIAGRITFGNVVGVEQISLTRSRGIQPSTIQFVVPVVPQVPIGRSAPLMLSDEINSFVLNDCLVQSVDIDNTEGERYVVTLLDHRWRWAYGEISGQYNTIRGGVILNSSKKKPKQLAEMCLKEMGVTRYSIDQLPNDTFPEVTWDLENPAIALENLCSSLGCVICPQLDGLVKIYRQGSGARLPEMQGAEIRGSFKMVLAPDEIRMSADATVWEVSLKIDKPFGIERTQATAAKASVEQMVEIEKLSYKPPGGWGNEDPMAFPNVAARQYPDATLREQVRERDRIRGLASESIWKIFGFKFPFSLPGLPFKVVDVNQIIFLDDLLTQTIIEYATPNQGTQYESRRQKPFVYGMYYDRKDTGKNNVEVFSHRWWENRHLIYDGGFSIDAERGVIVFGDPVYKYDRDPKAAARFSIPELYLRVAIAIKDPKTSNYVREVWKQPTGWRNGTKPKWVKKSDIRREVSVDPESGEAYTTGDTLKTVEKELEQYAKYELEKLVPLDPQQGSYSGFIPIELDGCVEQVSYAITSDGETETTASYGYEHSMVVPSYEERRRIMLLNQFANRQSQIMNERKDGQR